MSPKDPAGPALDVLRVRTDYATAMTAKVHDQVQAARSKGATWQQIATATRMHSRQAAQHKFWRADAELGASVSE